MPRTLFQIKITGPWPEEVSARTLAEVLMRMEDSVIAFAKESGLEIPTTDGPLLSLVDVSEGSPNDVLTFSASEQILPALAVISGAIATSEYDALPRDTHVEIFRVSEKVRSAGWGLEFVENARAGIPAAVITPERGVSPPPEPSIVHGTTTLLARCLRVGGATSPKAEVRLAKGGPLLHLSISESLAKQLGKRLYEEVLLHGTASWDSRSWELTAFHVEKITDFERLAPSAAFRELSDKAGDAWDNVDVLEFVKSQRGED
jgi:hypothetical protein